MKRKTPKNYHKPKLQILSQEEKNLAFARAKEKIADLGLNDIHLKTLMSGNIDSGVYWSGANPFVIEDGEAIWEDIYNDVPTDKILDTIYNNKGKANPSKYLKEKYGK